MVKANSFFVCQNCGQESSKWLGKCPKCGQWNTFVEELLPQTESKGLSGISKTLGKKQKLIKFSTLITQKTKRQKTNISEFDRALGGGLVPGSLILMAGDPGIGKSTLVTQLIEKIGGVYVCAEESPHQVKLRFQRMGFKGSDTSFLADNNIDNIIATLHSQKSSKSNLLIIDSIQTVFCSRLRSSVGSASQIKECSNLLLQFAKRTNTTVVIIGHITKEGAIAGPKMLEHLVDVVFYLSGDKNHQFRLLQSVKNRFGATDEVGIFTMTDKGLDPVSDPSRIFMQDAPKQAGSCLTMVMQGQRPLLVEVQALCVKSKLAMPRRVAQGFSLSKLQVICAVLQKHLYIPLYEYDVFVSIAGGLKVSEPAIDLAIATAIHSSVKNKLINKKTIFFGELGLLGDIRSVSFGQKRLKEAKRLGFSRIISAENKYKNLKKALNS